MFLVSDGVSDNFCPDLLGVDNVAHGEKGAWACQMMRQVLLAGKRTEETAPLVVESLLEHCFTVTEASRAWHESGSPGKLPEDYRRFLDLVAGQVASRLAEARAYEEQRRRVDGLTELHDAATALAAAATVDAPTPAC